MASFVLTNLRILAFVKAFLFYFVQIIRVVSTIYLFICLYSKLKLISYCAFYGPALCYIFYMLLAHSSFCLQLLVWSERTSFLLLFLKYINYMFNN